MVQYSWLNIWEPEMVVEQMGRGGHTKITASSGGKNGRTNAGAECELILVSAADGQRVPGVPSFEVETCIHARYKNESENRHYISIGEDKAFEMGLDRFLAVRDPDDDPCKRPSRHLDLQLEKGSIRQGHNVGIKKRKDGTCAGGCYISSGVRLAGCGDVVPGSVGARWTVLCVEYSGEGMGPVVKKPRKSKQPEAPKINDRATLPGGKLSGTLQGGQAKKCTVKFDGTLCDNAFPGYKSNFLLISDKASASMLFKKSRGAEVTDAASWDAFAGQVMCQRCHSSFKRSGLSALTRVQPP